LNTTRSSLASAAFILQIRMAPVKFDDLNKTANDLLNDDYQTASFQFKAKQKTNFDGAVATTTVDLFPPKDSVQTPAKLSWKFPKPLGILGFSIDKLEMDKKGAMKLETSAGKELHKIADLKVEGKSNITDIGSLSAGLTYTGLKDTQIKCETKIQTPQDFAFEATRAVGPATLGLKFGIKNATRPDLGVRLVQGPFFGSLLAKSQFNEFIAHGRYVATPEVQIAASYTQGGKNSGKYSVGLAYDLSKETKLKAKLENQDSIHLAVKHEITKGFTQVVGMKYNFVDQTHTYGVQLSIE